MVPALAARTPNSAKNLLPHDLFEQALQQKQSSLLLFGLLVIHSKGIGMLLQEIPRTKIQSIYIRNFNSPSQKSALFAQTTSQPL
jgi:hypothetical protein